VNVQLENNIGRRIAVLVDGDNVSPALAARIAAEAALHGRTDIVRVYTDAHRETEWHSAAGFRLMHAGTGKNAADLLLSIDAMELALSNGFDGFVIASSDGDFAHLAQRLREYGLNVIGMGETKAPASFRSACNAFVEIGSATKARPVPTAKCSQLDHKIRAIIAGHSKKGSGMRIADLAPKMHSLHQTRISQQPEGNWRAYLSARPHLYDLDPRGPEAKVRFRPDGFAALA
jgi:hypothetical protein